MLGKRLTIFIGESDQYRHGNLYMAILNLAKKAGCAGATVTRGIAGFGAHARVKTIRLLELSVDLPVVVTIVDSAERIAALLPEISAMMAGGTITLDDTEIVYSSAAFDGGLPDVAVESVMRTDAASVRVDTTAREVVQRLVAGDFSGLPVLDEQGVVVGFVDDGDLIARRLTALSASEHRTLGPGLLAEVMHELDTDATRVGDVMHVPAITVQPSMSLRDASHLMHLHAVKHLPVVDASGKLLGVLGRLDVLRSIVSGYQGRSGETLAPLPQERSRVADVMARDVASVAGTTPLSDVLTGLLDAPTRELVVLDADHRPQGVITVSDLIARIDAAERPGVLLLLKSRFSRGAAQELRRKIGKRASDVMTSPVVTIGEGAAVIEALSTMVTRHLKHLVVVDGAGRLVGVITRTAVLAASLAPSSR